MPFISAAQKQLLVMRLMPVVSPTDGGVAAQAIAGAITDWLEQDALPVMQVLPGIPVVAGAIPGPGATTGPGTIK